MPNSSPLVLYPAAEVTALGAAASSDVAVFVAPFACTVTSVEYTPSATITGAATNNRTLNLRNKGQTGVANTVVATLQFVNGTNAAAYNKAQIPVSGTPANLVLLAGDVLALQSLSVGTGIADPGGLLRVQVSRS